jgi:alpha-amylase/alpha-mannosidase (GH57 family)
VSVILDGENPWEYYPDGGKSFLRELYTLLAQSSAVETTSVGSYLERCRAGASSAGRGSTGFNIGSWREITSPGTSRANARESSRARARQSDLPAETLRAAWNELYAARAATGSGGGDDFSSIRRLFAPDQVRLWKQAAARSSSRSERRRRPAADIRRPLNSHRRAGHSANGLPQAATMSPARAAP